MKLHFHKYQGTGNDFVILDDRQNQLVKTLTTAQIKQICDRKFGIGADGLMLVNTAEGYDFRMVYYNADGSESTMCGNGGRCIAAFARSIGVIEDTAHFIAIDGPHRVRFEANWVELEMMDVQEVEIGEGYYVLNTGSPHYVKAAKDMSYEQVFQNGRDIRYSERFKAEGINVNFVNEGANGIEVATYERGVEDETLSCGTGVTACSIATALKQELIGDVSIAVQTKGGALKVKFHAKDGQFTNVWLCGPATFVFEGTIEI